MSVLKEICSKKRSHIETEKAKKPLSVLMEEIGHMEAPRGFIKALKTRTAPAIIAEIKKASPSRGVIREDFDVPEIAKIYEKNGACCLSVLTDQPYFQGQDDFLRQARAASSLPVLRKDFMLDLYQVYEARALGADCILLIMAALDDHRAAELHDLAKKLEMDVLVEVHDEEELERALNLKPEMIGVNNRSLKTLEVDIQTSHDLSSHIPEDILKITESGIGSKDTINELTAAGYRGFLIGESLMKEDDIGGALKNLIDTEGELK